jgi:hypothetical protein
MKEAGLTPRRYGLRVREHPDGLLVTAMNKMSHGQTRRLSYSGQLIQTAHFVTALETVRRNKAVVDTFLNGLGGHAAAIPKPPKSAAWLWQNVKASQLVDDLLRGFSVASESWRFQKPEMIKYISRQAESGELVNWTVALVNTRGDAGSVDLAGCQAGIAERKPDDNKPWESDQIPPIYSAGNSNIQSPSHQALDLAEIKFNQALLDQLLEKRIEENGSPLFDTDEATLLHRCLHENATLLQAAERLTLHRKPIESGENKSTRINGEVVRQLRPRTHGLLLIYPIVPKGGKWPTDEPPFTGLAFSFPSSHTAKAVDYRVNRVWQDTFQDSDYADWD